MKISTRAFVISALLPLGSLAAVATPTTALAQADQLEEIVVTGSRYRARQEIAAKQETDVIFDSLSADEISSVPDFNLADAFRRIPGVSAEFDEDEGRFINIRGIDSDLNRVMFDGITLPSTGNFGGNGREVNIEFLPSTAVKTLEVYKTFTPDLDGSSIGGYVNVVTRSAFDVDDTYFVTRATLSEYELTEIPGSNDTPYRIEATGSNRFGENDEWGVIVTGLYGIRPRDQSKFFGVAPLGGFTGASLPPNRFNVSLYNNNQTRFGANGRLEYQKDTVYAWLSAHSYQQEETEVRYVNNINAYGAGDVTETGPTTGTVAQARSDITTSTFPIETKGTGVSFHVDKSFANDGELSFITGLSEQNFDHDSTDLNFRSATTTDLGFTYDTSGDGVPTRSQVNNPAFFADPTNYTNNFTRFRDLNTDEEIFETTLDYGINVGRGSEGFGWKIGAGFRNLERVRDNEDFRSSGNTDLASVLSSATFTDQFQPDPFLFIDTAAGQAVIAGAPLVRNTGGSVNADFTYEEDITTVFAMAVYAGDRYRLSGGLRFEDTSFHSTARSTFTTEGDFSHVLPSINWVYDLTDDVKFRAAFSQTLGRPDPADLVSTISEDPLCLEAQQPGIDLCVSRGNPDLEPRESDNFDLSLEYYFLEGDGLLSAALFYKDISGDIFRLESIGPYQGSTALFTQNLNSVGSEVQGVELIANVGSMPFLPGAWSNFGVTANFTFIDGEQELPTQAADLSITTTTNSFRFRQPEFIGNTALFYSAETWEARIAWTRTDQAQLNAGRAEGDYEQFDFSVTYRPADNWGIGFQARNFTGENRRQFDDANNFTYLFGETDIDASYHLTVFFNSQ